jgi:hypothetical protein
VGDVGLSEQAAQIMQAAVTRPGDVLLVRVDPRSPKEAVHHTAGKLRELLPDVEVAMVGAEDFLIYRPGADA